MDNLMSLFTGVAIGILTSCLVMSMEYGGEEKECEKAHNVYDCEMVFVPASPEE